MLRTYNNKYGKGSQKVYAELDPRLAKVFEAVLPYIDHSLVVGKRGKTEQNALYKEGLSELQWPESKHNVGIEAGRSKSHAVDAPIYLSGVGALWGNEVEFTKLARKFNVPVFRAKIWFYMEYARYNALVQKEAELQGIKVRWGGDWNSENGILDQSFDDFFHWEIEE